MPEKQILGDPAGKIIPIWSNCKLLN